MLAFFGTRERLYEYVALLTGFQSQTKTNDAFYESLEQIANELKKNVSPQ